MALAKFGKVLEIVKANGGWFNSTLIIWVTDELKEGRLCGQDHFGNQYFENNRYFMCRNRWVIYNWKYFFEYDGSHVPPEWHGWLHNMTDLLPCEDPAKEFHCWLLNHMENPTGSIYAYYPYSTTKPKITAWDPKKYRPRTCGHILKIK